VKYKHVDSVVCRDDHVKKKCIKYHQEERLHYMTSHEVSLEQITDTNSNENNTRSCVLCMNLQKEAYAIVLIIGLVGHLHMHDS